MLNLWTLRGLLLQNKSRKRELLLEATDLARMNRGSTFVPEKIYNRISISRSAVAFREGLDSCRAFSVLLPCVLSLSKAGMQILKVGFQICKCLSIGHEERWYYENAKWLRHSAPKAKVSRIHFGKNKCEIPSFGPKNVVAQTEGEQKLT